MSKIGKFINKYFYNKKIEMYVGDSVEWFSYADSDSISHLLLIGTLKHYDDDTGVITFMSEDRMHFFIAEDNIRMFWEAGRQFDLFNTSNSTIRSGKGFGKKARPDRDIMNVNKAK